MKTVLAAGELNCFFAEFFRIEQSNWDVVLSVMQKMRSIWSRRHVFAVWRIPSIELSNRDVGPSVMQNMFSMCLFSEIED
jgi:hypothetical protein